MRTSLLSSIAVLSLVLPSFAAAQYYDDPTLNPGYRGRNTEGLTVTVSDTPDPVVEGQTVTYTISIRNNFSSAERMVVTAISDAEILSASDESYRGYDRVTWDRVSIPADGTKRLTVRVRAPKGGSRDSITLRVQAGGRTATETTRVDVDRPSGTTPPPNYVGQKQFDLFVEQQNVDGGVRYKITIGNRSNATVHGVNITQLFNAQIRDIDISNPNGGVDRGDRIEWDAGNLRPFEYRVFQPTVRFRAGTPRSTIIAESEDPVIRANVSTSGSASRNTNYSVPYAREPQQYVYRAPEPLAPIDRSYGRVVYPQTGVISDFFKKAAKDSGFLTPVEKSSSLPIAAGVTTLLTALGAGVVTLKRVWF